MIIFHLITSLDKGGVKTHHYSLIKKKIENKFTVDVFNLRVNDYWKKYLNKLGVKVYNSNVKKNYDLIRLLKGFNVLKPKIIKFKHIRLKIQ